MISYDQNAHEFSPYRNISLLQKNSGGGLVGGGVRIFQQPPAAANMIKIHVNVLSYGFCLHKMASGRVSL